MSAPVPAKPATPPASPTPSVRDQLWLRRGLLTTVLAVVLWWPVGFGGTGAWLRLPLEVTRADTVFLGALAAATAVGILVPWPWPRFLVVAGYSVLGWVLSVPPVATGIPHQRLALAVALAAGGLLGLALGSRAQAGTGPLATALAVLVPLCLIGWLQGPLLAVALALPFVHASRDRVAPTVLGVVRVVAVWLATALFQTVATYGWDTVRAGAGLTVDTARAQVLSASGDLLRTSWDDIVLSQVQGRSTWLWVAAVLALVVVSVRVSRSISERRAA